MTIEYAILGLLSWKPFSGYDLKKIISESAIYYWSGNNNQIYKTLLQLHQDGWVSQQVINQQFLPARKVYSITPSGNEALQKWLKSLPDLPEFRSVFLIKLEWAELLNDSELDDLLEVYLQELKDGLVIRQEENRREIKTGRSPRETYLWQKIAKKTISVFEDEIEWVEQMRIDLKTIRENQ